MIIFLYWWSLLIPDVIVGLKNWLPNSFTIDFCTIEDGINEIKVFCLLFAKMSWSPDTWYDIIEKVLIF